jgi:hypothetical protein
MNEELRKKIESMITLRLLAFHDALVERGQIQPHVRISPPEAGGVETATVESITHYTGEHAA